MQIELKFSTVAGAKKFFNCLEYTNVVPPSSHLENVVREIFLVTASSVKLVSFILEFIHFHSYLSMTPHQHHMDMI